jgi:hypothetical protein
VKQVIHILQLLCANGHGFMAVAWDDADMDQAQAAASLDVVAANAADTIWGGRDRLACNRCGSVVYHKEDGLTDCVTLGEAEPLLRGWGVERGLYAIVIVTRSADRN